MTPGVACSNSLPLPTKVEPTSRKDAAVLADALTEALPDGALLSKYRRAVRSTQDAVDAYTNLLNIRSDFQLVDISLCECSRLVAGRCIEQARVIEMVRFVCRAHNPWSTSICAW